MLRASHIFPAGHWPIEQRRDVVTLDHDARHRRRIRMVADGGLEFLLDLDEATVLRHGDGLALDEGGIVAVAAAPEPLMEVTAGNHEALLRLAWHIGNRHLPAAIEPARILLREDHVIEDMLLGLGARVRHIRAAFDPEGGAYAGRRQEHAPGHHHYHEHHAADDHGHDH